MRPLLSNGRRWHLVPNGGITHQAHPTLLPQLLSNLLRPDAFASNWKLASCIPIPKLGRTDYTDPENLCRISLLSCLGKTFKIILVIRLNDS